MGNAASENVPDATAQDAKANMTWADIVREVATLEEQWLADGSMAWYRGHADAGWKLKSTLHREVEAFVNLMKSPPLPADQVDLLRKEYKKEYRRFRSRAWPLLDQRERSDWGIVFAMQHYGQITRLFDWSERLRLRCVLRARGLLREMPESETECSILDARPAGPQRPESRH